MADLLLWRGDEAVLADRGRRGGSIAWLAPVGTQWGWRIPGTRGLAPTREDAQAAAEATLRAVLAPELHPVGPSLVVTGRQTWDRIRQLLEQGPLTVREIAERAGAPPNNVTDWLRRRGDEVQPVGLRVQQGAERVRRVVVWGLR